MWSVLSDGHPLHVVDAARGSSGGLGAYMITGEDYGGSSTGGRSATTED